jgi:spartin
VAANLGGGVKNVGLVYIDVCGVSRRAIIKSVARGMIVGKVKDGRQIVVGGTETPTTSPTMDNGAYKDGQSVKGDAASVSNGKDPNGKKASRFF